MLNHFCKRWSWEYLIELRDSHCQQNTQKSIKAEDIVLIHDQDHLQGFWKIARVQSLITGKDGVISRAELRISSKGGLPTTLQWPLQLLYPLEIRNSSYVVEQNSKVASDETFQQQKVTAATCSLRPERAAAVRGRQLLAVVCSRESYWLHLSGQLGGRVSGTRT